MVKLNIDTDKYKFTTKNILDNFNVDENVIYTRGLDLKFYFNGETPYLLIDGKEYRFESSGSVVFFLQKLSLNSNLITSLSNEIITNVVNEMLQQLSTFNILVDKNTNQILTVAPMTTDIVSWRKIIQTVYDVFVPIEEKTVYVTTSTGLGISIVIANIDSDLEVIRVDPQTHSSISLYRGVDKEEVPLRGYDEGEIMKMLREKLEKLLSVSPALVNG